MAEKEVKKSEAKPMASPAKKAPIDMLLENSIALQKTLATLATDLKTLNQKVSSLLALFDAASKTFKEKPATSGAAVAKAEIPKELIEKIDALIAQNKTIARGMLLLEQAIREINAPETGAEEEEEETESKPLPEI